MKTLVCFLLLVAWRLYASDAVAVDQPFSCGASSVYTVLRCLNIKADLTKLEEMLPPQHDSSANEIVQALKSFGLNAKIYQCIPEDLLELSPPYIAHIKLQPSDGAGTHFLPIVGVNKDHGNLTLIDLNLNRTHPITMPIKTFSTVFTGYVVVPSKRYVQ